MFLYSLLTVVSYYVLSVLPISPAAHVSDEFPKTFGIVGGVSSIQVYFGLLNFFNFAKPLIESQTGTFGMLYIDDYIIIMI